MIKYKHCPFCNSEMHVSRYGVANTIRYTCQGLEDHTYIQNVVISTNAVRKVTLRVGAGEVRYYLQANDLNEKPYCFIWSGRFDSSTKIELNSVPDINLSEGIEFVKNKIIFYLSFS